MLTTMILTTLLAPGQAVDVLVTTSDKASVTAQLAAPLEVKTSFGTATIDGLQLSSIRFGKPTVIETADGTRLNVDLQASELAGQLRVEQPDFDLSKVQLLRVFRPARLAPGAITHGMAANGMTYSLRLPTGFEDGDVLPAIVIFHGSNMSASPYVNTIARAWPEIAERYLLLGFDGEREHARSSATRRMHNYTYIRFTGRSKYRGLPGSERESPALIAEALRQLREQLPIDRIFVGGHSQGGYLTYVIAMHYPEMFDGAFAMSAGLTNFAQPRAFQDDVVRQAQRDTPIAIVHGKNDSAVSYRSAVTAELSFLDAGFPMLRLFSHQRAGHSFAALPLHSAVKWLERMSCGDSEQLVEFAREELSQERYRDAIALLMRARALHPDQPVLDQISELSEQVDQQILPDSARFAELIQANQDNSWVDDFLDFRREFEFASAARPAMQAFAKLRKQHQPEADELYQAARTLFRAKQREAGYAKYAEVIENYYASSWYAKMKTWLANRD